MGQNPLSLYWSRVTSGSYTKLQTNLKRLSPAYYRSCLQQGIMEGFQLSLGLATNQSRWNILLNRCKTKIRQWRCSIRGYDRSWNSFIWRIFVVHGMWTKMYLLVTWQYNRMVLVGFLHVASSSWPERRSHSKIFRTLSIRIFRRCRIIPRSKVKFYKIFLNSQFFQFWRSLSDNVISGHGFANLHEVIWKSKDRVTLWIPEWTVWSHFCEFDPFWPTMTHSKKLL